MKHNVKRCGHNKILYFLLLIMCLVVWFIIYFRYHLLWLHTSYQLKLNDVSALPECIMPYSSSQTNWSRCVASSVAFFLPLNFATNVTALEQCENAVLFRHDGKSVFFYESQGVGTVETALIAPYGNASSISIPELRKAIFQTSSSEFSLFMTQKNLFDLTSRMAMRKLLGSNGEIFMETYASDDITGIAIMTADSANYHWQIKESQTCGFLNFFGCSNIMDNMNWIRAVCQSIRVIDETRDESDDSKNQSEDQSDQEPRDQSEDGPIRVKPKNRK